MEAKSFGISPTGVMGATSMPNVVLNSSSTGCTALAEADPTSRRPFSASHRQSMTDGTNSALAVSLAVMASFSSLLRLLPTFLPEAISSLTASASWNRITAPDALRVSRRKEKPE